MATLHEQLPKRITLGNIERELDWTEIAIMTRAAPARILGLEDKGHLGVGADADVTIYDLLAEEVDTSADHALVKKSLATAKYTIKSGVVVSKEGQIRATPKGRTYWVDASVPSADTDRLMVDLVDKFEKYYSIQLSNYAVQDAYLPHPMVIKAGLETESLKEVA
jgi:formylmethanofuran dehydrogenase subunit A